MTVHYRLAFFLLLTCMWSISRSVSSQPLDVNPVAATPVSGYELSLLTPERIYGSDRFHVEARLISHSQTPSKGVTAFCKTGEKTYVRSYDNLQLKDGEDFVIRFDEIPAPAYGQPVSCEVWTVIDGQMSERISRELTLYSFKPHRRTVVEEITGMWCPNCPTGTLAMDSLSILYPDEFIGIALHSRDPLQQSNYVESLRFEVLPSAFFNRKYLERRPMSTVVHGEQTCFILGDGGWGTRFEQYHAEPTVGEIEVEAELRDQTIYISTQTRFALSMDGARYRIAFVVVEDHVKDARYYQYNNFGGTGMLAGGYENLPYVIQDLEFNHVGHAIYSGLNGIPESVPEVIVADEVYTFEQKLNVPLSVTNPGNARIVALLIDPKTGEIINAAQTLSLSATGITPIDRTDRLQLKYVPHARQIQVRYQAAAQGPVQVRLYDDSGRLRRYCQVSAHEAENGLFLPVEGPAGIYLVSVVQGNHSVVRKLIIS